MPLDPLVKRYATGKNFAALTTLMPDGQPMTHIMWVDADDEHVIFNTDPMRKKFRNVLSDPRVVLTIWNHEDPTQYVEVRGVVVETITGEAATAHLQSCARRYRGSNFKFDPTGERVIVKITPHRVRTNNL